ncbi:MAG: P-type conjugative transfer protein TrbL [Acidithiobacillus sp.]|nr:P-type conjugative transfer protein TrbL [Acidithiobacillus sp.]
MNALLRKRFYLLVSLFLLPVAAHASTSVGLSTIMQTFQSTTQGWYQAIFTDALGLFGALFGIEIVWLVVTWLISGKDVHDIFTSFVKKLITIGFFYTVLEYSSKWVPWIIGGFKNVATSAGGEPITTVSNIAMTGIRAFVLCVEGGPVSTVHDTGTALSDLWNLNLSGAASALGNAASAAVSTSLGVSLIAGLIVGFILLLSFIYVVLELVAVQLEGMIVLSVGVIMLGFGGARWTARFVESYMQYALAVGVRFMILTLWASFIEWQVNPLIKSTLLNGNAGLEAYGIVLILALLIAWLTKKLPGFANSILSGQSTLSGGELYSAVKGGMIAAAAATAAVATGGAALAAEGAGAAGALGEAEGAGSGVGSLSASAADSPKPAGVQPPAAGQPPASAGQSEPAGVQPPQASGQAEPSGVRPPAGQTATSSVRAASESQSAPTGQAASDTQAAPSTDSKATSSTGQAPASGQAPAGQATSGQTPSGNSASTDTVDHRPAAPNEAPAQSAAPSTVPAPEAGQAPVRQSAPDSAMVDQTAPGSPAPTGGQTPVSQAPSGQAPAGQAPMHPSAPSSAPVGQTAQGNPAPASGPAPSGNPASADTVDHRPAAPNDTPAQSAGSSGTEAPQSILQKGKDVFEKTSEALHSAHDNLNIGSPSSAGVQAPSLGVKHIQD